MLSSRKSEIRTVFKGREQGGKEGKKNKRMNGKGSEGKDLRI